MRPFSLVLLLGVSLLSGAARAEGASAPSPGVGTTVFTSPPGTPTPADAQKFVDTVNAELKRLWTRSSTAEWIKSTYITDDTERNAAAVERRGDGVPDQRDQGVARASTASRLDPDTGAHAPPAARSLSSLPAPSDAAEARASSPTHRREARGHVRQGQVLRQGRQGGSAATCRSSRGRHGEEPQLRRAARRVDGLARHRAADARRCTSATSSSATRARRRSASRTSGALWRVRLRHDARGVRGGHRAALAAGEAALRRPPLLRARAARARSTARTRSRDKAPIPAHLLGNMWAQEWTQHLPRWSSRTRARRSLDVDAEAQARRSTTPQGW